MGRIYYDAATGLAFYIFPNDHDPPHVHVYRKRKDSREDKGILKIAIGDDSHPPAIARIYRKLKDQVALDAWRIVAENQQTFLTEWQKYHGN
jgi:Domain of unknown function (DUF4160)